MRRHLPYPELDRASGPSDAFEITAFKEKEPGRKMFVNTGQFKAAIRFCAILLLCEKAIRIPVAGSVAPCPLAGTNPE
jgi:hypothetical protein